MLTKRELIALKIESTYNTDSAPTAIDAMLVENVSPSYEGARLVERNPIKPTLGKEQSIHAGNLIQLTFDAEMKGSGVAGTAPEIGQALRACGFGETIVASTSVTYEPVSESIESCTIYYYQDGKLQVITGARGTVELNMTVGDKPMASFTFTGHDAGDSDAALISGTYDNTVPPPVINGSFDVGGFAAVISALSFNLGNEVVTPPDFNSPDGYSEVFISDRDMSGSFDPEYTLKATQDWIADWKNGVNKLITTGVIGSAAGNRIQLDILQAYYRELGQGDRDSIRTLDIGFGAVGDDNAMNLIFT